MLVNVQNGLVNIVQNAYVYECRSISCTVVEENNNLYGVIKTEVAHAPGPHLNKWVFSSRRNVPS